MYLRYRHFCESKQINDFAARAPGDCGKRLKGRGVRKLNEEEYMNDDVIAEVQTSPSTIALLNASEIDQQIATAHKFPRSLKRFRDEALQMVTLTESIAAECIYALPRDGKVIEGPSARFAEVIFSAWGNSRSGARVVSDEGEFVKSQGVFHDLERNTAITYEVTRRIINKHGKRFSADMIGVTANAACSIALRNAILKGIPKAFWADMYAAARRTAAGDFKTLANRRADALKSFVIFGVKPEQIFALLGVGGEEDIGIEHLITLRGMLTALQEGDSTPDQMFGQEKAEIQKPRAKSETAPADKATNGNGANGNGKSEAKAGDKPPMQDGPIGDHLVGLIKAKLAASDGGLTESELFKAFKVESYDQILLSQFESVLAWIKNPQ